MTNTKTHKANTNGGGPHDDKEPKARKNKRTIPEGDNYKLYPALASYIDRIGAEQLNFRRFMVKEHRGAYYLEKAVIRIAADGSIKCTTIDHAPTDEERVAIKAEVRKCDWPKSCLEATTVAKLKVTMDKLHIFWDRDRKHIMMCQERVDNDDGKIYIPWTFFSDGKWRCMEPDGDLPFWKPPKCRNKCQIMIHEGAKAAAFCDDLVNNPARKNELKAHPWGNELADYEHWGMIGGALAPHRTDYAELYAEKPSGEVVYVCDNDYPGMAALKEVSRHYGRPLKGIKFGLDFKKEWPARGGWDLADPMPEKLFRGKRWIGPTLKSLKCFATYATEKVPVEEGKKGGPQP